MVNYSNSYIYKICCKDTTITDTYIGSTTNLSRRNAQHKYNALDENSTKHHLYVYQFIKANGGWQNFELVMIEPVKAESKMDLKRIEREYVETFKPTLNKNVPFRTPKESNKAYREKNKEKIKEINRIYREKNKEKIKAKNKAYRDRKKLEKLNSMNNNNELHNSNSILQQT